MYSGLGVLPVIVTTAVNLLVPAIESLFKSNYTYSFPDAKDMIDNWAGTVNLDPTLVTPAAQWAFANVRCMAGDTAAGPELKAIAEKFPTSRLGPFTLRITPNGPVPVDFAPNCAAVGHPDAAAYATAALRVLTTRQQQQGTDLYSGTLPAALPDIPIPVATHPAGIPSLGGVSPLLLVAGVGVLALALGRGGRS